MGRSKNLKGPWDFFAALAFGAYALLLGFSCLYWLQLPEKLDWLASAARNSRYILSRVTNVAGVALFYVPYQSDYDVAGNCLRVSLPATNHVVYETKESCRPSPVILKPSSVETTYIRYLYEAAEYESREDRRGNSPMTVGVQMLRALGAHFCDFDGGPEVEVWWTQPHHHIRNEERFEKTMLRYVWSCSEREFRQLEWGLNAG